MTNLERLHNNLFEDPFAYHTFSFLVRLIRTSFGSNPITGVEIGTMRGGSAFWLMTLCRNITHLYTVDPWEFVPNSTMEQARPSEFHNNNFEIAKDNLKDLKDRITIVRDYSDNFFARMVYEGKKFDFVWIDGHHEKFQVVKDINNAKVVTRKGGLILGHDFINCPGVKEGVDECFVGKQVQAEKCSQIWSIRND